ncbi:MULTISPECIES: TRAP transporter small permease subunit [Pacificibacter]|uniref:TRAP transporter small permease subunit n=1 Tax=Pacificibacter TaxID=1042323 RepID=UPI001C09ABC4|nr:MULTISPECIES: TRAP transporter small permease subunit [Pacificibacter]MBU2934662.1 TRAP transporter small permease subunit [Pacificibacter marinus]MDO6616507.1 TRAP transporter small permease subunit [Pacificibacter sp. 1_MG-2023]
MIILRNICEQFSTVLGFFGRMAIFCLIASMLYEVVARYAFGAPTLWAFDISYMLNGSIFLLGAAYSLQEDAHVRIDFLSQKFPRRVQQILNGLVYLLVMAPIGFAFTNVAATKALKAFKSGELESVSPWAPHVWPFYTVITLGLLAFSLQFIVEAFNYLSGAKTPGETNTELQDLET